MIAGREPRVSLQGGRAARARFLVARFLVARLRGRKGRSCRPGLILSPLDALSLVLAIRLRTEPRSFRRAAGSNARLPKRESLHTDIAPHRFLQTSFALTLARPHSLRAVSRSSKPCRPSIVSASFQHSSSLTLALTGSASRLSTKHRFLSVFKPFASEFKPFVLQSFRSSNLSSLNPLLKKFFHPSIIDHHHANPHLHPPSLLPQSFSFLFLPSPSPEHPCLQTSVFRAPFRPSFAPVRFHSPPGVTIRGRFCDHFRAHLLKPDMPSLFFAAFQPFSTSLDNSFPETDESCSPFILYICYIKHNHFNLEDT